MSAGGLRPGPWMLVLALTASGAPAGGVSGQPPASARSGDSVEVASNPLEAAALAFAHALASGSGDRMSAVFATRGIRLQMDGVGHAGLSSRQAVASLRDYLRGYDGGRTVVVRTAPVEGSSDRGFAEILWSARVAGTSQIVQRTLFVGLVRETAGWRVEEVRILP